MDPVIFFFCYQATADWPAESRQIARILAGVWIFLFAKSIKLMGHFIRYPADFFMLPVSIAFGYVHGILKLAGLLTLHEVRVMNGILYCW